LKTFFPHGMMRKEERAKVLFDEMWDFASSIRHNKRLEGTKYFPDFLFLSEWHRRAVVVECDEGRHATYCRKKEALRERVIMDRLRAMGYDSCLNRWKG
jgi:fido (protein-threonine AMPylation protein)